eukprot:397648_1
MTSLQVIELSSNDLTGGLPDSIGMLSELWSLSLWNNSLNGTIVNSLCLLQNLSYIHLEDNNFTGSIPSNLFHVESLVTFVADGNLLTGSIPNSLCYAKSLRFFSVEGNSLINTIPECIGNASTLQWFQMGSNAISGTIPNSICNIRNISDLVLSNNMLYGTYPSCINESLTHMKWLILNDNDLTGTIQSFPPNLDSLIISQNRLSGDFPVLPEYINNVIVYDNAFSGKLSTIFENVPYDSFLTQVMMHNNNFHGNDAYDVLDKLFSQDHINIITLYNNDISGFFPNSETFVDHSELEVLLIHNMGIYGSLPSNLTFSKMLYMTLYGNRLSCSLPDDFVTNSSVKYPANVTTYSNKYTALIFSGNLFSCSNEDNLPYWIKNSRVSLYTAKSVYITSAHIFESELVVIIAIIISIGFICMTCYRRKRHKTPIKKELSESLLGTQKHEQHTETFDVLFVTIEIIKVGFTSKLLMLLVVILVFIYVITARYYDPNFHCMNWSFRLSLSFYFAVPIDQWLNWVLITVWSSLIFFYLHVIISASNKISILKANEQTESEQESTENMSSTTLTILKSIIYVLLYLLCLSMTCLYIISESLPSDNILPFKPSTISFIRRSIALILAMSNALVIPKMVDSFYIFCDNKHMHHIHKHRAYVIFVLRTWSSIIIPFIFSIILLNDCGKGWTRMWDRCYGDDRDALSVAIPLSRSYDQMSITLSAVDDLCNGNLRSMQLGNCLRQFFYVWTSVIIQKVLIMIFMPFIVMSYKIIKYELLPKIFDRCCECCNKYKYGSKFRLCLNNPTISIDMEYAMIATKIETMILFSFITPFVVPITIFSIYSNSYVYHYLIKKKKWNVLPYKPSLIIIPLKMALIGVFIAEILLILFSFNTLDNVAASASLVTILMVINILFMWKQLYVKRQLSRAVNDVSMIGASDLYNEM